MIAPSLPRGSRFGQRGCGPEPRLPGGVSSFPDTCHHLHVELPSPAR